MLSERGRAAGQAPPDSPWFPFGTADDAPVRLVCMPHAGAGASVYRSWGRDLPPSVAACPVQPPGRERRRADPPATSAAEIARELAPEILQRVRPPYAVFGHSAGAVCAFDVIREIRRLGGRLPVHLFVAGRRPPRSPVIRTRLAGLPPAELAEVLRRLGGTPEDVLTSLDLVEMLQPLLVADFHVNESYRYRAEPPLPIPVTAFASTRDHFVSPRQMAGWARETSCRFTRHVLDGGHFAIFEQGPAVLRQITAELR